MRFSFTLSLLAGLLLGSLSLRAQQVVPAPLSEDSVRVMSGLVQSSVRQLRSIYFEPNDAHAVELINTALQDIPALNQRLSHYTASLPQEQQAALAQRLRQQPWQVELRTLLRSPQFRGFDARAAKNPALQEASTRLKATGFVGSPKAVAAAATTARSATSPAPTISQAAASPKPAAAPAMAVSPTPQTKHTVQKGETLYSIAQHYGITPAQLQALNDKASGDVKAGEVLVVEATK
ncbi:LysM repeat-containing protein [Hymenobacter gelipurpurascens]|uniref:LysM repeat-containing protein n=1 Tax=Hymenobacter gelipurpurascens TaxID=89968 RepID=A0A212UAJ0_9BACT|nr:LysM peptidoglycan-binding domain-containing protein [Hymenobacter gelipurpurascens]SNC75170.1 LysM repeat-containing protein [Hymenobacter gelipurpurascens]